MKPRVTLTLIVAGFAVPLLGADYVWAENDQAPMSPGSSVCYEYSNDLDEQAVPGGGAHDGLLRGMVLYTEPPDPIGAPDPKNVRQLNTSLEVDAIANFGDAYFPYVVRNQADLLVSFKLPNPPPNDPNDPFSNAIYYEWWNGARGVKWTQANCCNPDPAGNLEDLDGLEIWGPMDGSDVNRYSVENDWAPPTATSVFNYVPGGPDTPYISQAVIANAVAALGYIGDPDSVDVDALMVRDYGRQGVFDDQDKILFSIRAAGNFDGGEIIYLINGRPPMWLSHGGHLWNTAFNVGLAFKVPVEEVDAIEAVNRSRGRYWVCMRRYVRFWASTYIVPDTTVILTAETPASMALSKDDTTETVDLRWASAELRIGPEVSDTSMVEIVSGHGEFESFSWNGITIPASSFTIEPDDSAGTVAWPEGHVAVSAKVVVTAIGFLDIEADVVGYGYLTDPPDSIDLVFGEAVDVADSAGMAGVPGQPGTTDVPREILRSAPNPFHRGAILEYEVPQNGHVYIAIYTVDGKRVRVLLDEGAPAGQYSVVWDGRDASGATSASGVYYCIIKTGVLEQMKKLVLMK